VKPVTRDGLSAGARRAEPPIRLARAIIGTTLAGRLTSEARRNELVIDEAEADWPGIGCLPHGPLKRPAEPNSRKGPHAIRPRGPISQAVTKTVTDAAVIDDGKR
jgi:hypothetical protein